MLDFSTLYYLLFLFFGIVCGQVVVKGLSS